MSDQDPTQGTPQEPIVPITPATPVATPPADPEPDSGEDRDYVAEIAKLRKENAKWRTQYRDAEKQVKELSPAAQKLAELEEAQKSEEQKLREALEAKERAIADAEAKADTATKQAKLALLASKANVNPELVELLDIGKLDFADEEAVLETLKQFSQKPTLNGGGASDPKTPDNTQPSEKDLRNQYFNKAGRGVTIFGS